MSLYLPIAQLSLNVVLLLGLGGVIGVLSGLFGVGGGFLMTPLLIFLGVPPAVAAATGANTVIAPSVSGALSHWRRRAVDRRMGVSLLAGGLVGSAASVWLFGVLARLGQIDFAVQSAYVVMLGTIGATMLYESARAFLRRRAGTLPRRRLHYHTWLHGLPLKIRYPKSKLYVSIFLPVGLGTMVGILAGLMGVGGGFVLVPAMIYLLGMPTSVVVGTSLFQIIFVSASVTWLQAYAHQTVDAILALSLIIGAALGAPLGARLGQRLRADELRILMAAIVVTTAIKLGFNLVIAPDDIYSSENRSPGQTSEAAQ